MVSLKTGEHPATNVTSSEAALSASRSETFRLPKVGGDPFFGFGRSFYYEGEKRGYWRLIRIRDRGNSVVLRSCRSMRLLRLCVHKWKKHDRAAENEQLCVAATAERVGDENACYS